MLGKGGDFDAYVESLAPGSAAATEAGAVFPAHVVDRTDLGSNNISCGK